MFGKVEVEFLPYHDRASFRCLERPISMPREIIETFCRPEVRSFSPVVGSKRSERHGKFHSGGDRLKLLSSGVAEAQISKAQIPLSDIPLSEKGAKGFKSRFHYAVPAGQGLKKNLIRQISPGFLALGWVFYWEGRRDLTDLALSLTLTVMREDRYPGNPVPTA